MNKWIIPQDWNAYGPAEHAMWDTLFARQVALLSGRAAPAFLEGLDVLRMSKPGIPDFTELSQRLQKATGWSVVAVPGLIPDEDFFENLANRRFVAGRFIRKPEQIDYLQEPDIFHDVFGHVPLLVQSRVRRLHAGLWPGRAAPMQIRVDRIGLRACIGTPWSSG